MGNTHKASNTSLFQVSYPHPPPQKNTPLFNKYRLIQMHVTSKLISKLQHIYP
jgi:hypothetical protein